MIVNHKRYCVFSLSSAIENFDSEIWSKDIQYNNIFARNKGKNKKESLSTALYKYLWAAYHEDDLEQQRN